MPLRDYQDGRAEGFRMRNTRRPKKRNKKAQKLLAQGIILWDTRAVQRRANRNRLARDERAYSDPEGLRAEREARKARRAAMRTARRGLTL